ncbi:hypothetical protein L6164_013114 [Bauhinia variegata]|uniref:Uncharacterized protein n=1 Tax=Bauhinia variegata TaxID=167791 RepID=A0ACB9PCF2_BAUVA|nr:hypothetical protein L6164_013114 [Bauhinia variegata]
MMRPTAEYTPSIWGDHFHSCVPTENGGSHNNHQHLLSYNISSDIFDKFRDDKGNFKAVLIHDVSAQHQKELSHLTEWWDKLDVKTTVPYARDRLTEGFFWPLDDTYDAYATIEELEPFTEAIERWDMSPIESLPKCMKVVFEALLDLFNEMELITAKDRTSCFVHYVKGEVQKLARAYLVEAKLTDDTASHKFERKREHVASAVECCMKQYEISEEEAYKLLNEDIENAWKDTNEECLKPNTIPVPVLECVANFSRIIELVYGNYQDKYTHGELLKDHVAALLVDPIGIEQCK